MKFKLKGIYSFDEEANNNYTGATPQHVTFHDFDSLDAAISYVADHHGFEISENGKFAFQVLAIEQVETE